MPINYVLGRDKRWEPFLRRFLAEPLTTRDVKAVVRLPMDGVASVELTADILLTTGDIAVLTKTFEAVELQDTKPLVPEASSLSNRDGSRK